MTEQELREKIVFCVKKAISNNITFASMGIAEIDCNDFDHIAEQSADALIAAWIGDVRELKKHRVVVEKSLIPEDDNTYVLPNTPIRVKQLYSGEEVENIVKERNELKVELRDKVDYIHEQDEVIKDYKHRAEVAERALQYACKSILKDRNDTERRVRAYFNAYLERAEKELAELKGGKQE